MFQLQTVFLLVPIHFSLTVKLDPNILSWLTRIKKYYLWGCCPEVSLSWQSPNWLFFFNKCGGFRFLPSGCNCEIAKRNRWSQFLCLCLNTCQVDFATNQRIQKLMMITTWFRYWQLGDGKLTIPWSWLYSAFWKRITGRGESVLNVVSVRMVWQNNLQSETLSRVLS